MDVNDNKKMCRTSQSNLQIFTNPLPSHTTNVVEHNDNGHIAIDDISNEDNNLVNFIEQSNPKCDICVTFESRYIIRALDGPLYIIAKIKEMLSHGVLIDPVCMVNVVIEEHLYTQ